MCFKVFRRHGVDSNQGDLVAFGNLEGGAEGEREGKSARDEGYTEHASRYTIVNSVGSLHISGLASALMAIDRATEIPDVTRSEIAS